MAPGLVKERAVFVTDTMSDVRTVEGLAKHFQLTVLAPASLKGRVTTWWPPNLPDDAEIVHLSGGRLSFIYKAARWLSRHKESFLVAYVLDNLTAALGANLAKVFGGPPTVLLVGRPTLEYIRCKKIEGPYGPRQWFELMTAASLIGLNERWADGIGCVSDYVALQSSRRNQLVRSIPFYGVNTSVFAPRWSKSEARKMLDLPQGSPIVLYRSRISQEKDPDTFLRAIKQLRDQGRDVTAVYMGGEMSSFAPRAEKLGVKVEVRDAASRDELPVWYVAADVSIQTSHSEGLGLSLVESLACGTPIVVTAVGGLVEVADMGRTGMVVPKGDAGTLAQAVEKVLADEELREALVREGLSWAKERYSAERAFSDWAALGRQAAFSRSR